MLSYESSSKYSSAHPTTALWRNISASHSQDLAGMFLHYSELPSSIVFECTVRVDSLPHRKWKKIRQQPSMLPGPAVPGCCWISLHFLWGKLSTRTVRTIEKIDHWFSLWYVPSFVWHLPMTWGEKGFGEHSETSNGNETEAPPKGIRIPDGRRRTISVSFLCSIRKDPRIPGNEELTFSIHHNCLFFVHGGPIRELLTKIVRTAVQIKACKHVALFCTQRYTGKSRWLFGEANFTKWQK